jgi:hypothetical protein
VDGHNQVGLQLEVDNQIVLGRTIEVERSADIVFLEREEKVRTVRLMNSPIT